MDPIDTDVAVVRTRIRYGAWRFAAARALSWHRGALVVSVVYVLLVLIVLWIENCCCWRIMVRAAR